MHKRMLLIQNHRLWISQRLQYAPCISLDPLAKALCARVHAPRCVDTASLVHARVEFELVCDVVDTGRVGEEGTKLAGCELWFKEKYMKTNAGTFRHGLS